jgi:hypothetical protein
MISPYKGKFHVEWYPNTTSTAFEVNDLVYLSSGYLTTMGATTDQAPLGLIQEKITATDDKYSTAAMCPVLIGDPNAEYLCDIGTGTGGQSYVGTWVDVDDTYPDTKVDVSASTYDTFFVTKHISTTKCVAKMQSLDPYQ